ncbi:MAG TPA: serine hydrolase domain-containing protein [Hyphomonadaceae bacterium]|nr:serine hydrolase domain-containing protein [Hyphomonadaceae bacterium]HPN05908.1 serine hydrolase domain-containing protein [Hyphomonadaceae bacterium]
MKRLRAVAAAVLVCVVAACAQAPTQVAQTPATSGFDQAIPAIEKRFAKFQVDEHIPGLVWGIVRDGQLLHLSASGVQDIDTRTPVNADTMFRIASMSKAFTALAILKLRDDGKLQLDAPAETYVPELKALKYPTTDSPRIRVRDLLSHVGGFVTDDPWGDRQQVLSEAEFTALLLAGVPLTRAPQTQMEYSNLGYALLGRIITNVSGQPYDAYIKGEIMRPLGMMSTTYEVRDVAPAHLARGYRWENDAWLLEPTMQHGVFGAMGGVVTNTHDYVKWMTFLLNAWPARDGADAGPVRRSTVRELSQGLNFASLNPRGAVEGGAPCRFANTYGMGMNAARDCDLGFTLGHSGGYPGYGSNVLLLPDQGIGLFAFANRTYAGPSVTNRLAALELHKAGVLTGHTIAVSPSLASAYQAAGAMFVAGDVEPGRSLLAMNFLMDRSAENWKREFARIRETVGACDVAAPITATGAMTGTFAWACERGKLSGGLILAPTTPTGIQALELEIQEPG